MDLSMPGDGMIEGATRVDAYSIPNNELKDYIEKREHNIIIYVLKNTQNLRGMK